MLVLKGVDVFIGKLHILKKISLHVGEGEIVALLGANGAGKTTLLRTLMGLIRAQSGEILYRREPIQALSTEERVKRGLVLVPEGKGIFKPLTVEENLLLGAYVRYSFFRRREIRESLEEIYSLFPILKEKRKQLAGTLSGGQQQILAIARALMASPTVLLLDEPSMGIAPNLVREIFLYIENLKKTRGISILLVEQNAKSALKIADRAYVLETGKIIYEGEAELVANNPEVQRAYLGRDLDRDFPV